MAATLSLRDIALFLVVLPLVIAQQCYYPNGSKAPNTEKPCSSAAGSACCPDNWQCMDNGLCYLPADRLYARYSCTDKNWKSTGCPSNLCTYDMSASGGEAITQCSSHNNDWCCDANREDVDCCQQSPEPRPFFALQDPHAYGTIGGKTGSSAPNLASITGKALGSGSDSSSSTAAPATEVSTTASSSSASTTKNSTPNTSTTLSTSISTGGDGTKTVVQTLVTTLPAASPTNRPSQTAEPEKENRIGLIVGCAVGIPLALALLGILIWLFRKRAQQKSQNATHSSSTDDFGAAAKIQKNEASPAKFSSVDPGVPELPGGAGIGPERPVSMIPGKAEMDSGGGFVPGTVPQSPHVIGVGGGNANGRGHMTQSSWGSAPPGYSPAQSQGGWARPPSGNFDPMAGQYQAYRPGMSNTTPMAELPEVITPPNVVESRNPSLPTGAGARAEYPGMSEAAAWRS